MPLVAMLLVLAAAPKPVEGPVAVLPFKNLGGDASLDWLRLGMPETLVADLKRARTVTVVERAQIDRALAELEKKGVATADDAAAAQVGKLLAAKTVVLGSFQRSGEQVRLAARFVTVETGVVTEAAKATGPLTSVFTVQDELVTRLVGVPAQPQRRGRPDKAIRAFELYGRSLVATGDPDRVRLLKQAVEADPQFSYAVEDLAALEARMKAYGKVSAEKLAVEERALLAKVENGKLGAAERTEAAGRLLEGLRAARRFNTLAQLAPQVGAVAGLNVDEPVAYAAFAAQLGLHRYDEALQAGERYLKQFPTGPRFTAVEQQMNEVVTARKKRASRQQEYEADLAEKRAGCAGKKSLECDWAPCIAARWNSLVGKTLLENCSEFLRLRVADPSPEAAEKLAAARFFVALSHVELGQWALAKPLLADVESGRVREWDEDIAKLRAVWPTD